MSLRIDHMRPPLASFHQLESIKVSHFTTAGLGSSFLSPGGLLPLLSNVGLLPGSCDNSLASTNLNVNSEISQGQALQVDHLTLDIGQRTINLNSVVVEDVDNNCQLSSLRAERNQHNTTNLDKALVWLRKKDSKNRKNSTEKIENWGKKEKVEEEKK